MMVRSARAASQLMCALAALIAMAQPYARAQQPGRTVADGVFTDRQATRGAAAYSASCASCHRADLGGADGPALKDERFTRTFAARPLSAIFDRISRTMPRAAPGSLPDAVYMDIVTHLLRENGFAAGAHELTADTLESVEVLPTRARPLPPVGEFSYVEVTGCLARDQDAGWILERAGDPVAITPRLNAGAPHAAPAAVRPVDGRRIQLVDAMAYEPERHRGHLVRLRGLIMGASNEQRMTISELETVAASCR